MRKLSIRIRPTFWLLALLIGVMNSVTVWQVFVWIPIVLVSVLIHELGHALMARWYGASVQIELMFLGGLTTPRGVVFKRWQEFLVVAMGPLWGLALALIAWIGLVGTYPYGAPVWVMLLVANVVWTVLNLLPVHPLDGGKLMATLLEGLFGTGGTRASYIVGAVVSGLVCIWLLAIGALIGGCLFLLLAYENIRAWKEPGGEQAQEELACRQLLQEGNADEVYRRLMARKGELSINGLKMLQEAASTTGHWKEVLDAGSELFREVREQRVAMLTAYGAAQLGRAEEAVNWLMAAADAAPLDLESALASKEFDPIRGDSAFAHFAANTR